MSSIMQDLPGTGWTPGGYGIASRGVTGQGIGFAERRFAGVHEGRFRDRDARLPVEDRRRRGIAPMAGVEFRIDESCRAYEPVAPDPAQPFHLEVRAPATLEGEPEIEPGRD